MIRGFLLAAAAFFVLLLIAARVTDAATDTVDASNVSWLVACALAGLVAGFLGARVARGAPALRYAAGIAGPALLALLFALTTHPAEKAGPWFALAITIVAAALGAAVAQRRR